MKAFTTFEEIEKLCEAMILDYHKQAKYEAVFCVDIEGFVTEYLGLDIVYESIYEADPGRIGFFSDGKLPVSLMRDGMKQQIVFPKNTVVIDRYLLNPLESGRKRFTIAHEGAHMVIDKHIPFSYQSPAFYSEFDKDLDYSAELIRQMTCFQESYANRAAACFLMPRFLVDRILKWHNGGKHLLAYEGMILSKAGKIRVQRMADAAGVSFSAFFTRLRELNLVDIRPAEEYFRTSLTAGGTVP